MNYTLIAVLILLFSGPIIAQQDSVEVKRLQFTGDFRFRIEHDWKSRRPDGRFRNDRSRLRYRFRFGLNYQLDKHSSFGGRIRTGNLFDQQGPHVTIGGEFGLVRMGFEKLFYQYQINDFTGWVGKNSMPLRKLNEMFWNDNVFPEGVGIRYKLLDNENNFLTSVVFNFGHFIINSNGQTFNKDSYLEIAQLDINLLNNRINIFPGFYRFNQVGNYPDGKHTYNLDYSILHIGGEVSIAKKPNLKLGLEFYDNMEDYSSMDSIPHRLRDQKKGFVISAKYGKLKQKSDWLVHLYYSNLQKYAIVDYFAQNDWVRWDYSSMGATGARISNFHGFELRIGYAVKEKFNLILRAYAVEEIIKLGAFKENGNRIRLDLNIGF